MHKHMHMHMHKHMHMHMHMHMCMPPHEHVMCMCICGSNKRKEQAIDERHLTQLHGLCLGAAPGCPIGELGSYHRSRA